IIPAKATRAVAQQQAQWGHRLAIILALGFGAGKAPAAPGTFGTLVAVPIYLVLSFLPAFVYALIVAALFLLGVWVCQVAEAELGQHDHPAIVWDEVVGFLITMFLAPHGTNA